jgi:hypothetical protein
MGASDRDHWCLRLDNVAMPPCRGIFDRSIAFTFLLTTSHREATLSAYSWFSISNRMQGGDHSYQVRDSSSGMGFHQSSRAMTWVVLAGAEDVGRPCGCRD